MRKKETGVDDHGFTLVEVLIAMLILAIIVVPLLHTFVSSSRANMRARRVLRVTTAAQDIMEGLKAYTIEELAYQFNYPDVTHAANPNIDVNNEFHVIRKDLINGMAKEVKFDGTSYTDVVKGEVEPNKNLVTASIFSDDNGETYEFLGARDAAGDDIGQYYFEMTDVSLQDDRNMRFDVLVHLDATKYRAGGGATPELNAEEVVGIRTMNNLYDAFYVSSENDVYSAIQNMNTLYSPATEIKEKDIQRTITIDVDRTTVIGKEITKATIRIKYIADGFGTGGTDIEYEPFGSEGKQIYNSTTPDMELRNVYLFYYPVYNSDAHKDQIIFNNNDATELQFHIAKQEPSTADSSLITKESSYRCDVRVKDTGVGGVADSATKVQTNLTTNLYDVYAPAKTPYPTSSHVKYYFNGGSVSVEDFGVKSLSGSEVKDRIFDITVQVYEAGAAANGFPEADRLVTLTGSKDN